MARRSLEHNVTAARREAELQRRWAEISCREAMLNRAEILLRTEELATEGTPVTQLQTTIKLGNQDLTLILSDEQSKLNLNTAFRYGKAPAVREALFDEAAALPLQIRPNPNATENTPYPPAFSGFGQLYDFSEYARNRIENETRTSISPLTKLGQRVTCWGNGQLNMNRADAITLRKVCELVVSPQSTTTILELKQEKPELSFEEFWKEADITDRERRDLRRILTDRSRCHSLWIITHDNNRSWTRHDIRTQDAPAGNDLETYFY
jgi:hypothetical protein